MEYIMEQKLSLTGMSLAFAGAWGISILVFGLLSHVTGIGTEFIQSVDSLYPGTGTGPRGILTALIFGIFHGAITGWLIALIYNTYVADNPKSDI